MAEDLHADTAVLRVGGDRLVTYSGMVRNLEGGSLASRRGAYGHTALIDAAGALSVRWARGLQVTADEVAGRGHCLVGVAEAFESADSAAAAVASALCVAP